MKLLVLPGDGIGPEIVASAVDSLAVLDRRFSLGIDLIHREVGFASLEQSGTTVPADVMALASEVDGVLLGPVSTEDFRLPRRAVSTRRPGFAAISTSTPISVPATSGRASPATPMTWIW